MGGDCVTGDETERVSLHCVVCLYAPVRHIDDPDELAETRQLTVIGGHMLCAWHAHNIVDPIIIRMRHEQQLRNREAGAA